MADSYSTALLARRGRGVDPSMLISQDMDQDITKGRGLAAGGIEDADKKGLEVALSAHAGIDQDVGVDDVPPDVKNHGTALQTPSDTDHVHVKGETQAAPQPHSQSDVGGDMESQIMDGVTGGATQGEYELLKGMRPRSLGERAKMDALKSKFDGGSK